MYLISKGITSQYLTNYPSHPGRILRPGTIGHSKPRFRVDPQLGSPCWWKGYTAVAYSCTFIYGGADVDTYWTGSLLPYIVLWTLDCFISYIASMTWLIKTGLLSAQRFLVMSRKSIAEGRERKLNAKVPLLRIWGLFITVAYLFLTILLHQGTFLISACPTHRAMRSSGWGHKS